MTKMRGMGWMARGFDPSREHTVGSAAALLMAATLLARLVGYLRDAYVAYAFGAGPLTDAYIAAFTLPDLLLYLAAGGSISITFISLYTRYLTEGREEEGAKAFSVIVSVMVVAFAAVVALGEVFAGTFVRWWFSGFTAEQAELCTRLTRILLPQPIFFLIGGVVSAVQQTRRQFLLPALAPVVYTLFIIGAGVLFSARLGIAALAVGATIGAFVGPFLLNALGAARTGIGYHFSLDARHPAFRQWLWMSVPLMLGISIVAADDWILRAFASSGSGDITRLNYAKRLLQVPIGVIGQAVGVASLPFFARLFSEGRLQEFEEKVSRAITSLAALSLLVASWMMAVALPLTDLAFRRGRFQASDSRETAMYLFWFTLSLVFWAVQGLYARAFYAVGDMWRPMIAGTAVTAVSLPIYWALFHSFGIFGLVMASNTAIVLHTLVLAAMLHLRGLVRSTRLDWLELGKAAMAAAMGGGAATLAGRILRYDGSRTLQIEMLALESLTWLAGALAGLWLLRSKLLGEVRRLAQKPATPA